MLYRIILLEKENNTGTVVRIYPNGDLRLIQKGMYVSEVTNRIYKSIFHKDIAYNVIPDNTMLKIYLYKRVKEFEKEF